MKLIFVNAVNASFNHHRNLPFIQNAENYFNKNKSIVLELISV